ncbi:hypothetical protein [Halorubrum ezzemoulense]|uniref:hypothetical protein n=2 Tax=Halorubrum ezzemoulense TaxID=337243 RepID=UPI000A56EFD8|nr:hypothetical protein [Halorubrum ezzemoulense]
MLMLATVGLKPCETTDESSKYTDGTCALCSAPAEGVDAQRGVAVCRNCAEGDA